MAEIVQSLIASVCGGAKLTEPQSEAAFESIIAGNPDEPTLERFLTAMSDRGETVDELVGAASVLRRRSTRVNCDGLNAIDTCGTGGDGVSTFNVSTAAAIVAGAAGAKVAKHGNCSQTRRSGSAEVMAALGVNVEASPETVARCVRDVGIGFLHAARLHPAMGQVAALRRKIGRRTIFNLLGPLTNPASVHRQIVGVPNHGLVDKIAQALQRLGAVHVIVVCGDGKLCEFTVTGTSRYMEVCGDNLATHIIAPSDVGLHRADLASLLVEGPAESAAAIRDVLSGALGPRRDQTLFNAGAALVVAGMSQTLALGVRLAAHAVDDGRARHTLERLVKESWR